MLQQLSVLRVRRAPLIIGACLALFVGTLCARMVVLDSAWWIWLFVPLVLVTVRRHGVLALAVIVGFCFSLGWWRGSDMMRQLQPYQTYAKHNVVVIGRATSDGAYDKKHQLAFTMEHLQIIQPRVVSLPGSISTGGFGAGAIYRGDVVQVSGNLYPTRGNNLASINFAELRVLESKPSAIDIFRRKFAAGLQSALPEPLASFGLGLLTGQRTTLPESVSEHLLMVGLTHIVAVSGYNLTIMVEVARRIFGNRSKFQTMAACSLLITSFLLITGNSPSIVRASIISMLSLGAWYCGRAMKPLALLLTAAAITVLANPMYIWGNVSWYLSFLAFFGVVVVAPLATTRWFGDRPPPIIVKMIIESLAAEVMTLPYVLYIFGQMSTVSLPANLLIAVWVPLAMLLCVIAGIAGMLLPMLAGWMAWPAVFVLTYMLDAAALLSRLPHAFIEHIAFGLAGLLASYSMVAVVVWLFRRRLKLHAAQVAVQDSS